MISHSDRARQRRKAHAARRTSTARAEASKFVDGRGKLRAAMQAWKSAKRLHEAAVGGDVKAMLKVAKQRLAA